jgi:hypothetical protein
LGEASLSVSTVFLSRRRGALLLRIAPENGQAFDDLSMELSLAYQTIDGEPVTETFTKDFSTALLQLMREGATQEPFYGGF